MYLLSVCTLDCSVMPRHNDRQFERLLDQPVVMSVQRCYNTELLILFLVAVTCIETHSKQDERMKGRLVSPNDFAVLQTAAPCSSDEKMLIVIHSSVLVSFE